MNRDWSLLKWAIGNIEAFTKRNEGEDDPTISDLEVEGTQIVHSKRPREIERANFIFYLTWNENSTEKDVFNILQKSTEEINRCLHLYPELESLPHIPKELVNKVYSGILNYNKVVAQAQRDPKTLSGRCTKKLRDLKGNPSVKDLNQIPLPVKYQIKIPSFGNDSLPLGDRRVISWEKENSDISKKVSNFSTQIKTELSRQTMDMYIMKAVGLLERKGLCNYLEARAAVSSIPIKVKCSDTTCEITQSFPTIEGPSYKITCVFCRDTLSGDYRRHISSSIELTAEDLP